MTSGECDNHLFVTFLKMANCGKIFGNWSYLDDNDGSDSY
jgi:hypothetical protein